MHALAKANIAGVVTAIVEIVNAWFELQMLTAVVISAGSVTFVFYGQLFRLGLEDKERKEKAKEREKDMEGGGTSVSISGTSKKYAFYFIINFIFSNVFSLFLFLFRC